MHVNTVAQYTSLFCIDLFTLSTLPCFESHKRTLSITLVGTFSTSVNIIHAPFIGHFAPLIGPRSQPNPFVKGVHCNCGGITPHGSLFGNRYGSIPLPMWFLSREMIICTHVHTHTHTHTGWPFLQENSAAQDPGTSCSKGKTTCSSSSPCSFSKLHSLSPTFPSATSTRWSSSHGYQP